jgi:NitT/TauT family transport system ATP-binding protein
MSDRIFLLHTNPGRIAKTILVPEDIRLLSPFQARQHPKFRNLFQSIWRELEKLEV